MASNKMLIDASHPEETRVVVLRGNRIEEFDFESQNKQQLKGNIYLAKVTRVEPSLQAAFVDYGGNRHGFLAFNEIHPDYYQIPVADRQALLEEEAEDARRDNLEDSELDAVDQETGDNQSEASDEQNLEAATIEEEPPASKPKRKRTRRSTKKAVAEKEEATQADEESSSSQESVETDKNASDADQTEQAASDDINAEEVAVEEKPKAKRTRRPRKTSRKSAAEKEEKAVAQSAEEQSQPVEQSDGQEELPVAEDAEHLSTASVEESPVTESVEAEGNDGDNDDAGKSDEKPTSIAAMMETESISEPAPEDDSDDESQEEEITQPEETAKPRRRARSTSRPGKKTKTEADVQEDEHTVSAAAEASDGGSTDESNNEADADEVPVAESQAVSEDKDRPEEEVALDNERKEVAADDGESDVEKEASDQVAEAKEEETKPKSRRRRRTSRARKEDKNKAELADSGEKGASAADNEQTDSVAADGENLNGENGDGNDEEVATSGQEDALEEVPQRRSPRRQYKIQEVIKRRQVLLVQVVKEERGNKGAALTTYLSLAGRYSVLMPNTARGGGISRKITNAADRKRLKTIASELDVPEGMGVILRTAGASRTKEEIQRDFEYLMRLWENVRNLTLSSSAPCLVYEEGSLIKRSIRDLYDKNTGEILVSGEAGYREAKDFMNMLMPSHNNRVHLYQDEQAMYARYGVEQQLDKMLSQQVTLKSGGYLVIDQTEALVAIDVNSGRATREHSIEDTALQTNLETAEEVARQLRLRDLAGLIVIDFIDMEEKRNNRAVEKKLKECLKHDRARIQVGRISHFGLLEMSRQRMRASVMDSTTDICPICQGKGHVRSNSSVCLHILRSIEEHLLKNSRFDLKIKTSMETASYILNHKRTALSEIEQRFGVKLFIEGGHDIIGENFSIEKGDISTGERKPLNHVQVGHLPDSEAEPGERDERQGKKRKRRRNRGNREDKKDEAKIEAKEEPQAEAVDGNSEESEVPSKKRQRGKRGGRNKRKAREDELTAENAGAGENTEQSAAAAEGEHKAEVSADQVVSEASDEDGSSRRKSRRTTRRKKEAAESEPTETQKVEAADEASVQANGSVTEENTEVSAEAEPKRTRRRTSRKKASSVEAEQGNSSENGTDVASGEDKKPEAGLQQDADLNNDAQNAKAEKESETPKKRSGWWGRGGFFK